MMDLREICQHERANMAMRYLYGYDQHDAHVWCWLLHALKLWGEYGAHLIRIRRSGSHQPPG